MRHVTPTRSCSLDHRAVDRYIGEMSTPFSLFVALLAGISVPAVAAPSMAISAAFEPRIGTYAALDDKLAAYNFAPVGSPFLPAWACADAPSSMTTACLPPSA